MLFRCWTELDLLFLALLVIITPLIEKLFLKFVVGIQNLIQETEIIITIALTLRINTQFIFFDAPHIYKCIRNNWYNLRNPHKVFYFPSNDNLTGVYASFKSICDLYEFEKDKIVKFAPKLNKNTINPVSFGKQNVRNALNIFDDTTSAGLEAFIENEPTGFALSTAKFLQSFNKIWKFLNIKTPEKGRHKNDPYSYKFTSAKDPRLKEIDDFVNWLTEWEISMLMEN